MSRRSRRQLAAVSLPVAALLAVATLGAPSAWPQEIFAGRFPQRTGEELYTHICQGCHMPDAKGAIGAGAYPALASNPRLTAAVYPITVVLRGQRAMISLGESLDDEQVATVLNYVRTHFGNRYKDVVTPAMVAQQRAALLQETGGAPAAPIDPRAGAH